MEGRTTRSKRKLMQSTSTAELYLEGPPSKQLYLSDSVVLTPPPSQHPPTPPSYTTRRRRQELETNGFLHKQPRYIHPSSLDQSSSSSDPSLHSSFHQDEMNLVFPGFDISSLVYNDTLLYKACPDDNGDEEIAGPSSDLHTPPGSPTLNSVDVATPMCPRPETPIPRPETPGDINPLTPSVCTDEVFEQSTLVGHSLSTYGPPPTPMCPPRVGSLSSTSLCVKLPLSSANSTASASAAPPMNILESDDDDDDDNHDDQTNHNNVIDEVDNITIHSAGTYNSSSLINYYDNSYYVTNSPDIVNITDPQTDSAHYSRFSPSPPHSPESLLSKHSHRLRIRAPAPRSCRSLSKSRRKSQDSSPAPSSSNKKEAGKICDSQKGRKIDEVTQRLLCKNISRDSVIVDNGSTKQDTLNAKSVCNVASQVHVVQEEPSTSTAPENTSFVVSPQPSAPPPSVGTKACTPIFLKPSIPSPSLLAAMRRSSPPKSVESPIAPITPTTTPTIPAPPKRFLSLPKKTALPAYLKRPLPPTSNPLPPTVKIIHPQNSQVSINFAGHNEERSAISAPSLQNSSCSTSATTRTRPSSPPQISENNKKSNFVRDGNIKSMRLQNFMSHREFYVEWNPNVNIINGPNGSGKSTIQTAFLLVFGAKAVTTQRTSTVRKLIKKGCTDAQIEVCLGCENGSLSKKKYGKEISLALKIKSNGACLRTVGIANGKRRKIKVPELTFICHALQIDPNNPVQFLKQERGSEASNVSANKKVGSERFTKFKQATQLQAKEEMVQISQENVKATMEFIQVKEKDRKNLALLEQQLRKEKEQIEKLEQTKTKIPELENECAWSLVKILEDDHKHVKGRKEETVLTIKEFKDVKKTRETEIANFHLKEEQNKKEYSITKKLVDTKNFDVDAKESELRERKRTQVRVQTEHNVLRNEVRNLSKEITILEGKKNEETINYQEQNQKAYMEIERLMALCKGHQKRLSEERLNRDTIDDELKEFKARIHTGNENIKKYNSQLNQTTKELNKRVNMGSNMNELIQKVTRYGGWTITPVGPLGAHITVPDNNARFAPLIEHILQIALYTFVVQCKEDFSKLTSFIKEIYDRKDKNKSREREPTVLLISSLNQNEYMSKLGKVKNKLHQLHFRTVLSMLTIKDRIVEIGLIERTNCERIVVFETNHAAAQVMKNPTKIPSEVKLAFTLEWFKVTAYPRFQFQVISQVKYHTDIIPMAKVEAAIHIKEEIAREQEVIDTCLIRVKGPSEPGGRPPLERQLKDSDERILLTNKEIHQLNNKIHQLQLCIKEVPSHAQEEKDAAKEIKAVMEMRAEREKTIQIKMHELELVKEEISRIQKEKETLANQIPPLQQKLEDLETQQNDGSALKLENEVENLKLKIERHEREFHQLSHQDQKIWDEIEKTIKSAPGLRPEVLNRKPEQVKRDIEDLKALLEKSSEKLKKKKRVISEHKNSLELLKKISDEIDILTKLYNLLEPFVKSNVDYYEKMKRGTGILLKANFQLLVEADGLTGGLVIDWEKETIVFYVSPDKQSEARARKNYSKQDGEMVIADKQGIYNYYNSLSGGERSKALVFFIMAMWKITDLPFHCLDEFEACLDDQSRIGIHEKLINHARNHSDAQFFIFTPLDLDGIPRDDPFITIHKLKLARR